MRMMIRASCSRHHPPRRKRLFRPPLLVAWVVLMLLVAQSLEGSTTAGLSSKAQRDSPQDEAAAASKVFGVRDSVDFFVVTVD